jgi:hypothetical protein
MEEVEETTQQKLTLSITNSNIIRFISSHMRVTRGIIRLVSIKTLFQSVVQIATMMEPSLQKDDIVRTKCSSNILRNTRVSYVILLLSNCLETIQEEERKRENLERRNLELRKRIFNTN